MAWCEERKEKCENCRAIHAAKTPPVEPPCGKCRVELMEENLDAGAVYMATRGQVITRGMDGVVTDISVPAIESAMRVRGVEDPWDCLVRVQRLFHHFLAERMAADHG